jgi:hypothetical protein
MMDSMAGSLALAMIEKPKRRKLKPLQICYRWNEYLPKKVFLNDN